MDETQNPLSSFSLEDLVKEVKARMQSYESAKAQMSEFVPERPPVAITKRAKHVSNNPMKDAAVERWSGWKQFKAQHKNATTKDYFAARRKA